MKKQLLVIGAVILFLTAFMAQSTFSQKAKMRTINIDFQFKIGKNIYPAGKYKIEKLETNVNLLRMENIESGQQALLIANNVESLEKITPRMRFQLSGEYYYLSQIFLQNGNSGFEVTVPRIKSGGRDTQLAHIKKVSIPIKSE